MGDVDGHALRRAVAEIPWWHSIDLGDGVVTPGRDDSAAKLERLALPADLRGKTVLDIGAWDGYFSFEAERRGAARVVAMDFYTWRSGMKRGFELARSQLGSRVEDLELRVEDLSADAVGSFDVVLLLGVLYHVPDMLGTLERVAGVTGEILAVETLVDAIWTRRPMVAYYPGDCFANDPSNQFGPNIPACTAMLDAVGFDRIEITDRPPPAARRIVAAARSRSFEPLRRGRASMLARRSAPPA